MPKQLLFGEEARRQILSGVQQLSRAVKATLGPKGRNVVIDKKFGSPTVTKDGVTVAKEIELECPYANMGAQMVKEVASKTSDIAGDGTTTATVLAEAIYREGLKNVTAGANPMELKRGIDKAVEVIVEKLIKLSKSVGDREQVAQVRDEASVAGQIWIANYLCPGNTVLSGEKPACVRATELIEKLGGSARTLAVAGAFHTPLMATACGQLEEVLRKVQIKAGRIPVVSNVDAKTHSNADDLQQILIRQVTQPVLWEDCVRELLAQGCDQFYEIGPGKVLKSLLKRIDRKMDCQSINDDG